MLKQQQNRVAPGVKQGWVSFVRWLAANSNLKVVIGSNKVSTDGKYMYLPELPYDLNPEDTMIVRGCTYHEVGHCRNSDFDYFEDFGISHGRFAQQLLNAIEDVWMETVESRKNQWAKEVLRVSAELLIKKGMCKTGSKSKAEALNVYVLCKLFCDQGVAEYEPIKKIAYKHFLRFFGESGQNLLESINDLLEVEAPLCKSTEDNGELTLKVIERLQETAQKLDDSGDSNKGNSSQANQAGPTGGSSGDSESSGKAGGREEGKENDSSDNDDSEGETQLNRSKANRGDGKEGQGDTRGDNDPSDSKAENGDGESEGSTIKSKMSGEDNQFVKANGEGSPEETAKKESFEKGVSDKVNEMLNETVDGQEVVDRSEAVAKLVKDIVKGWRPEYTDAVTVPRGPLVQDTDVPGKGAGKGPVTGNYLPAPDRELYKKIKAGIGREAAALCSRLKMMLQSESISRTDYGRRGRIAPGKLYRIPCANSDIFRKDEVRRDANAAVSLLADLSGSTDGQTAKSIQESAILMLEALKMTEVKTEIFGFGANNSDLLTQFKLFDESNQIADPRLGSMQSLVGGGTPLANALFNTVARLMKRQETRKVMFILTDGDPDDVAACELFSREAAEAGVKLIYMLIGDAPKSDWLIRAGLNFINVRTANDLSKVVMNELKTLLK